MLLLHFFSAVAGCASRVSPQLYPNEKLRSAGPAASEADVHHCIALADQYLAQPNVYLDALKSRGIDAAVGAGAGAVGGAIFSNAGRGTAAGAVGGILGVLNSLRQSNEPSPSYERFVERCLQERGYEVVGWS